MAEKISSKTAQHYTWGGLSGMESDACYLVRTPELHIIEERMPAGAAEKPHHHIHARQFFYVLEGELTLKLHHLERILLPGEGLEIAPGELHQAINANTEPVRFLITSQPPSHGDRVDER
jgi:mannose-6-phosphate isomerase-like protein (cupin superfamily)